MIASETTSPPRRSRHVDLPKVPGAAVIPRCAGQVLHIGENISVTVMHAEDGKAVLAVHAPRSLSINRGERQGRES